MRSPELFDLHGRSAIVTGGASGLGRVAAQALVEAGASVVITSRVESKLRTAVSELSTIGTVAGVVGNVREESSVETMFDDATNLIGSLDVLIANAGTAWVEPAENTRRSSWMKVLETNLVGSFMCSSRFARDAISRECGGSIVLVSSIAGQRASGVLPTSAYAASKAGLAGMARQLAVEWARHDITVNALAPGHLIGGMSDPAIERHHADLLRNIPAGRFGESDDLKGPVVFLASRASRYVTGQVLPLDGGQSAW